FKRWSRDPSVEVAVALELGEPPEFDGVRCADCGNRFRNEFDHVEPHVAKGPSSTGNLEPRCFGCHQLKTERDRKAGKLKPPESEPPESEPPELKPPEPEPPELKPPEP
ncbi:MAG: HNH endonuclease, partial [Actinomycetota bacterium]